MNCIWGVNNEGRVIVRRGISDESPMGRDWSTVDADPMKWVCIVFSSNQCRSISGHSLLGKNKVITK